MSLKPSMMSNNVLFKALLAVLLVSSCKEDQAGRPPDVQHIVVIGVDGMSPDGIKNAETPTLDRMIQNGASTMHARSVLPSSSSPNWASMLMGADTEQHGITSNAWERHDYQLPPVVATGKGTFPTIFTLFKDQRPEAHVGAIYDWDGFGRLFEKEDVDFDLDGEHEDNTTELAVEYIKEKRPSFTFVHLDHVDHAGHSLGHGSPAYYESVAKADSLIQKIVEATQQAGIFEKTLFLICADHGGIGKGHGGESPGEMEIPFILYGAGIKKGYEIEETVYQFDNAPTVAFAMGLKAPQAWIGRAVKGAFLGEEKPEIVYKRIERTAPPRILPWAGPHEPAGGIFKADSVAVTLENPSGVGEIRYLLGDRVPTMENSQSYLGPFHLKETQVIRAGIFDQGILVSTLAEGNFRLVEKDREDPVKYGLQYGGNMDKLPNFTSKPIKEGYVAEFSARPILGGELRQEQVALLLESHIEIEEAGTYDFYTNSDDGSRLYVDGKLVVDNDGDHGVMERRGEIELSPGRHLIRVVYFNGGGGHHLDVKFQGPKYPKQIVPANLLFRKK